MRKFLLVLPLLLIFSIGCGTTSEQGIKESLIELPKNEKEEVLTSEEDFDLNLRPDKNGLDKKIEKEIQIPDILNTEIDKERFPIKWAVLNKFGKPDWQDITYHNDDGKEFCLETWYFGNIIVRFRNGKLIGINTLNPAKIHVLFPSKSGEKE